MLYRPILEFLEKRSQSLKQGFLNASGDRQRIEEIDLEIRNILESAKREAKEIKALALQDAQKKYDEGFERARSELESRFLENKKGLIEQNALLQAKLCEEREGFVVAIEQKINQLRSAQ